MRRFHLMPVLAVASAAGFAACNDRPPKANDQQVMNEREIESDGITKVMAEIWVDNWFALSVNGAPLIEDSVPFKTERSFNAERVTFNTDLPATVAFEFRERGTWELLHEVDDILVDFIQISASHGVAVPEHV